MPQKEVTIEVVHDVPVGGKLPPTGYMSVRDAATYLSVTSETIRRWISSGRISASKVETGARGRLGWRWIVDTREVERLARMNGD